MRARWVKPEFFFDRKMAAIGPVGALVFMSLWLMADDYGTAPCDPDRIKGTMFFAWDSLTSAEISEHCAHLVRMKILTRFRVGDDVYCRIRSWDRHQLVHKPGKFHYPTSGTPLSEDSPEISELSPENGAPPRLLDTQTPIPPSTARLRRRALRSATVKNLRTSKQNWVPRFEAELERQRGGVVSFGRLGKALKPLIDRHGEDAVFAAWERFLASPSAKFGAEWFAANAGDFLDMGPTLRREADGTEILPGALSRREAERQLEAQGDAQ